MLCSRRERAHQQTPQEADLDSTVTSIEVHGGLAPLALVLIFFMVPVGLLMGWSDFDGARHDYILLFLSRPE